MSTTHNCDYGPDCQDPTCWRHPYHGSVPCNTCAPKNRDKANERLMERIDWHLRHRKTVLRRLMGR